MSVPQHYSRFMQFLHWLIALAIGFSWYLAEQAEEAIEQGQELVALAYFANHKSVGMTIFGLALVRLVWRQLHARPLLPESMPSWQKRISKLTHYVLYFLLIGLPLTGWLGSSAASYSVSWFKLFSFPDLLSTNQAFSDVLYDIHHALWSALKVLLILHVAAAFKHALFDRDGVMSSMWNTRVFVAVITLVVVSTLLIINSQQSDTGRQTQSRQEWSAAPDAAELEAAAASWRERAEGRDEAWQVNYLASSLSFTADQAGATFEGLFRDWQSVVRFDPKRLDLAGFDVSIALSSVATGDDERDMTLVDEDFFAVSSFPSARFIATEVHLVAATDGEHNANTQPRYVARGYLQLKGSIQPLNFEFSVAELSGSHNRQLIGKAVIDRHTWRIGEGEWSDDSWIGPQVVVSVVLLASI